jgi:methyl-accepting chemotaxis protein
MKLSLKNKFLLPTVTATLICLAVMSVFSHLKSSKALENSISDQVEYVSASISKQLGSWVQDRKKDVANLSGEEVFKTAADPSLSNDDLRKTASSRLETFNKNIDFFEFVALADAKGNIIASSDPAHIGTMNVLDRDYFQESFSGKTAVSRVIKSKGSGNPIFCISSPVKQNNAVVGVLLGAIDLNYFTKAFVDSEKVGETGYVYIIDTAGLVIAYPDKSKILVLDLNQYDFGRRMMEQKNGLIHYTFNDIGKIVAFAEEKNMGWIIASTANEDEIFDPIRQIRNINAVLAGGCVLIIAAILFLVTQSIVGPINRIIQGMEEGANQVAAASGQVSASSQSLAQGASEQAASIEETSASMEEMSSMTKKNAENSAHANSLMKDARQVVTAANESMVELTLSMKNISKASEETFKIIKTIDEIAFQTNLLALNAAVEAARAGEAGAGFAVVADEVRNLAVRAANAAKNTSDLIEGTVKKIHEGSELVSRTSSAFGQVSQNTEKVGVLVAEISSASGEQSNGIEQVNIAISEMDKVVQQNAANAEESASASEEMNAQAEHLSDFVGELVLLVTGKRDQKPRPGRNRTEKKRPLPPSKLSGPVRGKRLIPAAKEIRPDQVIRFEGDEDFKDF